MKAKKQIKRIRPLFDKWITNLGLRWWQIDILYYSHKPSIKRNFRDAGNGTLVVAETTTYWMYGKATIKVNLRTLRQLTDEELEFAVVHELMHILINEMRNWGLDQDHEERVVTQLTKAVFWTVAICADGTENADEAHTD